MADWGILQQPNFTGALLGGYQAGAALGQHRRTQEAMRGIDLSRPESILPLVAADPEKGVAVLGASMKMADVRRQADADAAFGDAVSAVYGRRPPSPALGGAPTTSPGALGGGVLAGGGAPSTPPDVATPTLPGPAGQDASAAAAPHPADGVADPRQAAMIRLAYKDREGFGRLQDAIGKMDEAQRQKWAEAQDALGTAAMSARALPYGERKARIAAMSSWLVGHGVPQERIESLDPTDATLDMIRDEAWGMKGIADQVEKDRNFGMKQAEFGETVRSHRANEAVAAENAATSRGQLGVARGRLALAGKVAGTSDMSGSTSADLVAIARGQKGAPKPSASDIFAIAGEH